MTNAEVIETIKNKIAELDGEYEFYGVRFEDKVYAVGETVENSKHNADREDERDFPEYGSDEYNELEELEGASAWNCMDSYGDFVDGAILDNGGWGETLDSEAFRMCGCGKVYLIAGNEENTHDDCDENEIVIEDAVVVMVLK